ncbi:serine-rich adhesin for platelets-like isoform X10 [Frieseomelitta varia]|uniref:serine-rich adhesin for platelets-like isoform X10 n=1 Tax=Frieseomelitta varia TaxID=561572 RepID=UPI001CB6B497|nr:serine-rich adhesin for platelets-like isoform X10 [Frieseomelitta varia]
MTSLILENADLNRLFPKCRPRGGPPPSPGASTQNSQPHESLCQKEAVSVTTSLTTSLTNTLATTFANTLTTTLAITSKNTHSTHSRAIPEDMIDLERDISDRTTNMVSSFAGDSQLSVGVSSGTGTVSGSLGTFSSLGTLNTKPLSSSSSSASGRSEDAQQYGSLPGSDQQSHSQQDDSGPEESPVYILTSAKGDRSYKLRDSRIIEIAGGREIFSQSRGKVAARKSRFLAASNSLNNEDIQIDNKLSVKRNNKSPNTQTIWELRSRCGDTRKQRSNREVTETVFSSEIHSVRHNPTKSIDYDSPKSNHSNRIINYDSILNSNNVEYGVSKNTVDLDYGLSKSCIDYQSNHTTPARSMAIVSDGEVVVFDDIDDNWQNLRLDLTSSNTNQVTPINLNLETEESQRGRIPPEPLSSSIGSTPSPTTAYHRNTSEFFKVITPASDCEVDSPSSERNHKVTRVIGELPIAQYSESPRRYGVRDTQLPCLLSSPSVYMTPRPGFPQRVLPTTPSHNEKEDTSAEIIVEKAVVETNINYSDDQAVNASPPSPKIEDEEEDSLKPSTIPTDNISNLVSSGGSTFDYLYEFSETRKVLEEFFKCPPPTKEKENSTESFPFQDLDYELRRQGGSAYVGQRLASGPPTTEEVLVHESPKKQRTDFPQNTGEHENNFLDLSVGTGSSEDLGETEVGLQVGHSRNFTLSPETTDCDSNCGDLDSEVSLMMMDNELIPASGLLGSVGDLGNNSDSLRIYASMPVLEDGLSSGHASDTDNNNPTVMLMKRQINEIEKEIIQRSRVNDTIHQSTIENDSVGKDLPGLTVSKDILHSLKTSSPDLFVPKKENSYDTNELQLDGLDPLGTPPPPAPQARQNVNLEIGGEVEAAIKDIRMALQRTKTLPVKSSTEEPPEPNVSPIWIPSLSDGRRRICVENNSEESEVRRTGEEADIEIEEGPDEEEADTDLETDRLLGQQRTDDQGFYDDKEKEEKKKSRNKEALLNDSSVLIEGVLFRARYLGSTQLVCEGEPTKSTRMCQAEEAVSRIKALAPDGETQPSTEVDLFISTEKIMVLNTDLKEIMMDHALRTISYIADIGDVVVLMARRRFVPHEMEEAPKINRTPKMICHVFESEEARFIAQSIGQAFQVAYMEFLKANGIEDHSFVKEMDYQEVLNSQEIFGDELQMFAKKEMQKEVVVPKAKGEILGVVIVESGWGSMLPTVVIANLAPAGAAARCGQLNIGDQIIAINGVSLVGLPLSTCQTYIKNSKNQTVVKLTVVPCAPVVEVKIKRPDTKYQLGFSVQNGVICSLLRGGIAERGGVRVGHRIIEINNQSVVAVPHEKIVNLLATSVGEILMKTMPTSMFRLLTGQESPVYI